MGLPRRGPKACGCDGFASQTVTKCPTLLQPKQVLPYAGQSLARFAQWPPHPGQSPVMRLCFGARESMRSILSVRAMSAAATEGSAALPFGARRDGSLRSHVVRRGFRRWRRVIERRGLDRTGRREAEQVLERVVLHEDEGQLLF